MKNRILLSLASVTASFLFAQDPHLHVNPQWNQCSFQLDPSLTQEAYHQFDQEASLVAYFRPLVDARPMGVKTFELSFLKWNTGIDEHDDAWNNTFVHPDSTHWLVGGEQLPFIGLSLRAGVSKHLDAGLYWTVRPGANYGFLSGQLQYNFFAEPENKWGVAARGSAMYLYGPEDVTLSTYGFDVLASRTLPLYKDKIDISPYVLTSTFLAHTHERSSVVVLNDENRIGVQASVGAVAKLYFLRLGVEYNLASVNTFSYKVGFVHHFGK